MLTLQKETNNLIKETQKIDYETVDLNIIAFKVELGEFLNEHKFFKFWKVDKSPNRAKLEYRPVTGDPSRGYVSWSKDPLIEELADCVAFMLAIALEREWDKFLHAFDAIETREQTMIHLALELFRNPLVSAGLWLQALSDLFQLADMMGITAEQIEAAYISKNQINQKRQATGY